MLEPKKARELWLEFPVRGLEVCQIQAKGYEENVVRAKGYVYFAKSHVPFGPNCHKLFAKFTPKGTRETMFGPKVSVRKWLKHEKGLKTRGFDKNGPKLDMRTT